MDFLLALLGLIFIIAGGYVSFVCGKNINKEHPSVTVTIFLFSWGLNFLGLYLLGSAFGL